MTRFAKFTSAAAVVTLLASGLILVGIAGGAKAGPSPALPAPIVDEPHASAKTQEKIVFAGGCFWGVQAVFEHVKGVTKATSGYAGGTVKNPNYEAVSTGNTGHAESVEVTYDPSQVTLGQLLEVFFSVAHDPTELNRQGPDQGTQYRSAIFFETPQQENIAKSYADQLAKARAFQDPIVTQIVPFQAFYRAESYHQDYLAYHRDSPYIMINDLPKLSNLKKQFPTLYVRYDP